MTTAVPPMAQSRDEIASSRRKMFQRLGAYLLRNRGEYALGLLATAAYTGFFVAFPIMLGWCIQGLVEGESASEVGRRCAWLVGIVALRSTARLISRVQIFHAAREIEFQIRNDLFEHLQRLPQSFYAAWRTGDLMSRCVNDLTAIRLMLGPGLLQVAQTPILMASAIIAMFVMDPLLAALVLLPYPLFLLIARAFGRVMHASNLAVQVGLADMSNHLQESVSGISVVKAYAMEGKTASRFDDLTQDLFERHVRVAKVNGGMPAVVSLLPMLGMAIIFLEGGRQIQAGTMSLAEFFTFQAFNFELTMPLFFLGWMFQLIQRGTASMERIDEVLSTAPSIADHRDVEDVRELRGEITFRGLSFLYRGSQEREPALEGIDLHIPAGSVVGIVGPVGAGKTTLASLVPRLFEVEDDHLFIDGIDVNRLPLGTLRSNIAMVPQDSFLFSMSIGDNVAYGLPSTEPEQVALAASRAQLAKDISDLPHGYDTVVGERGVMLSGGQRQRTALARALALDPRILILDDTLSAVDAETEAAIRAELREVFRGRTVIVVASRVSTVREADLIVVLEGGRIVDQGRHEELIARGGLYARLAEDQAAAERRNADWAAVEELP